jgi:hypothetical protein
LLRLLELGATVRLPGAEVIPSFVVRSAINPRYFKTVGYEILDREEISLKDRPSTNPFKTFL